MLFIGTASFRLLTLFFTVTLFSHHLVTKLGAFRFEFPAVHRVVHQSENNSIKYQEQTFCIKFAFQASIEQDYLSKLLKLSFWGVNKNVNSITKSEYWISKRINTL